MSCKTGVAAGAIIAAIMKAHMVNVKSTSRTDQGRCITMPIAAMGSAATADDIRWSS
jgi:hypothetical protein